MLSKAINATTLAAQVLFSLPCPDCGAPVVGKTKHKKRCDDCRIKARRESDRIAADAKRRKAGIKKVKGETFACERCSCDYVATSKSRQSFCPTCRPIVMLERARAISYEKGIYEGRKRVGRVETCKHCRANFTVTRKGNFVYCGECTLLAKANKLPDSVARVRAYAKTWVASHPKHSLNAIMRRGILRSVEDKAGRSWTSLVPYTVEELMDHLERQFTDGMTWENRGLNGWHIDHRLPLSSFSYTSAEDPEFQFAWSLANLQPMWGDENIRKKDQILYLI
ncbi:MULTISPECIES: hypothetical protein [unclassified Rhizobium]|uniref:hypothetical protein n=1 Tax=unclassified Rhizobium TaxID=2613769 RepID=UPI000AB4ED2E|nr:MULTISPECIES: hypothetical protein [unclassified Rhizobium]